ncbi:MAG: sulfatase [Fuerstiella sp.]
MKYFCVYSVKLSVLTAAIISSSCSVHAEESPADRPNFVFIITDDISPDDLAVYGNTFVPTPNLQRMAESGLVFDNAYLTISSCSPSRCSMITGRYPHNTGAPELHTSLPTDQRTFVRQLQEAGYHTVLSGKNHMGKPAELGFDESYDARPAGSEKWVQHLKDRPRDRPFFCWFASHDAHYDFRINDKAPTFDPAQIEVPPMLFDGPGTREMLSGYYHEVARTDHYVGQVLDELQRQNIADNTYVIYCSDNGRPFPRCKTYLYESGIQTPLLITGPGIQAGRTDSLVSSIDVSATILELADVPIPDTVQGRSFQKVLADPHAVTRHVAFAERNWHVFQNHARAVRCGNWLYIRNAFPERHNLSGESATFKYAAVKELWEAAEAGQLPPHVALLTKPTQPAEMLFHVVDDPHQFHNRVNDSEAQDQLNVMRGLLEQWVQSTGDSVPNNPTPDRQPIHSNNKQSPDFRRGDFPGADRNATQLNAPGPVQVDETTLQTLTAG